MQLAYYVHSDMAEDTSLGKAKYWGPAEEEWLVNDARSRGNRGRKNMEREYYIRNTGTTRLWECRCRQSIHYL